LNDGDTNFTQPAVRNASRLLYCPSISGQSDSWTQAACIRQDMVSAALYGGSIYYATGTSSGTGLWRLPAPETRSFRPILAAPGGVNLVTAGSYYDSSGSGSLVLLTPGAGPGEWIDRGRVVRAPVMSDRVFRLQTSRFDPSHLIATLRPSVSLVGGQGGA